MTQDEFIEKIKKRDIEIYKKTGCVMTFNKDYPNCLIYVNALSSKLTHHSTKRLYPKLVFIVKYDSNSNKISEDVNKIMFSKKTDDFKIIDDTINSAKKQWDCCKVELKNVNDLYSKVETVSLLKDNYKTYFGKSGNRRLLKENKKLFLSLYEHTKNLDKLNQNLNKFTARLEILINNPKLYCDKHKKPLRWRLIDSDYLFFCSKCDVRYPSIEYFKKRYGDEWEFYDNKRKIELGKIKANSKPWFIKKYGEEEGPLMYANYVEKKMENLSILKKNRVSKISQELFWEIYKNLADKENIYFQELNKEFVLTIPKKYKYKNTVMMLDFKKNNKIIEYNGTYWHNENIDKIRYDILNKMDYQVMVVTSDEYNRNKKNNDVVNSCIKFLTC